MSFPFLQSFFGNLTESAEKVPSGPVDIKDVANFFPTKTQKAVDALNKDTRLTYAGKNIFDELYDELVDAASKKIEDETAEFSVEFEGQLPNKAGNMVDAYVGDVEVEIGDSQEVYLGYYPKGDLFVMGFDAWMNEEDFWEELEKQFRRQGVSTDTDVFDEACNKIWNDIKKKSTMCSIMVQLEVNEKGQPKVTLVDVFMGGWYDNKFGGWMQAKDIYPGLLDIRLD